MVSAIFLNEGLLEALGGSLPTTPDEAPGPDVVNMSAAEFALHKKADEQRREDSKGRGLSTCP